MLTYHEKLDRACKQRGYIPLNVETLFLALCQCTGLKDRNGKLIYEGDVLSFNGFRNPVYFDDGSFVILHMRSVFVPIKQNITDVFEIIGNIHEDQFRNATKKMEE